ncbi:hypothetical protein K1F50_14870 [Muricauda oceani]|uniref:Uncharacterized protein n=1 Tax=Flagellimonas oceani TaxID=2698672 RepID=A0A6G7J2G2_9FLAO|nr:hypothetical protein [Allomuricauda oceani]MBW8244089.1 hypothetical protein [Allomuricauda oceani]QII45061.1 hypothetical protein GVT53_10335 [Allomuricauda oceani]
MDKTCLGLDRFDKGLRNSIRPIGKGAYGKLSECRRWCPDGKSLGTALFFDAPKNNEGFFYYGPLKICWADKRICGLTGKTPRRVCKGRAHQKSV